MLRKIFLGTSVFFGFISAKAQTDSTATTSPFPTITGSVDAYYRHNFDNPKTGGPFNNYNNYTSFTNSQNSFQLGMASVRADHIFGKASATIDLGFGPRAEEFSYADPAHPTLFAVKQAYLSYSVSGKIKLTMGKWFTHVGYEVPDAYLNRNYSMDYMFSYGPFSQTGLKADISLNKKSAVMIGVSNITDEVAETGSRRYAIAQFSTLTANNKVNIYLNYEGTYGGSYNSSQFDLVVTGKITDKFSVAYNGTVQAIKPAGSTCNNWWGSAVYLMVDPSDIFGITLRGEYFDNKKAVVAAPATSIFDLTLSPNIRLGNLTVIPELRLDTGQKEIFEKSDNTPTKSTFTALLAATYHF